MDMGLVIHCVAKIGTLIPETDNAERRGRRTAVPGTAGQANEKKKRQR
jgi:hypothetical protein